MKRAFNNNQFYILQKLQFTITSHSYTITKLSLLFDYSKLDSLSFYIQCLLKPLNIAIFKMKTIIWNETLA